ncbi:DUF1837 domain-containing protein [Paraburkholderia nemoris]|uniref:Anti-bacteriophage protein A/HamA C-terminal domain-containing protein n=1 Tax=Paraburkholderia nemoris TaxID=2793076 RepID=A0ABN7LNN1_9BURK|nr:MULTISPECIES: DUF1837 domain-containing protein [Paraburkholderia]MBK3812822.1 DUF1837 domain-containing protein [Paraburkholderia aspalathi]CAE6753001.1 hypothetical protein R69776_03015 [Paraburkholderia nemoris]CAE6830172.1 hypothetical protein R75777_06563 [Paraburkholderia nemoris]
MEDNNTVSSEFEQYFEPLLGAHVVQHRIRRLAKTDLADPAVSAYFLYPAFENGRPGVDALVQAMKLEIPSFCTTKQERAMAQSKDRESGLGIFETQMLVDGARDLFIKATGGRANSGEGGELLLFAFIEHFLRAPIILSKMRLKTNTNMPVHGSDGVHARWDNEGNRLVVIFGESKVHATLPAALQSAAESVGSFVANVDDRKNHELLLTTRHIDLDGFPLAYQDALKQYLHPFATEEGAQREDRFAILLAYTSAGYANLDKVAIAKAEAAFQKHYSGKLASALKLAKKHLADVHIALEQVDLFILPMPSVQEFRDKFDEALRGRF